MFYYAATVAKCILSFCWLQDTPPTFTVSPELYGAVAEFFWDCDHSPSKWSCRAALPGITRIVSANPDMFPANAEAFCRFNSDSTREVWVRKRWRSFAETRAVIYHELGHCALFRPHVSQDTFSLMTPQLRSTQFYQDNWAELVKELFWW